MINFVKKNPIITTLYLIYLTVGLFVVDNFGVGIEEHFQRSSGFFWLKHLLSFTNFEVLKNIVDQKIIEIYQLSPQLPSVNLAYYYGIIFDLPMAYFESIFNIKSSQNYFYLRHVSSFLIFFISGVFFFKIIKIRTSNNIISFFGSAMYLLAPKAFGNSFFDGKDLFFLSVLTITIYYYISYEKKKNFSSLIIFSIFASFATSSRIFGLMIPVCFFLLTILELINSSNDQKHIFKKLGIFYFVYIISLHLHWPYMWSFNFSHIWPFELIDLKNFFAPFKVHGTYKVFFNGEYFESNFLPINYLPKWILISTPIYFLMLFFIGYIFYLKRIFLRFLHLKKISINNDLWKGSSEKFDLINFLCFFQVIAVYFTFNMNFIKGWTHFIFLNFFLIYFSTIGIYILFLIVRKKKKFIIGICLVFILFTSELVYKLTIYHPYQYLYLNNFINKKDRSKYEADYQSLSRTDAIKDIMNDSKKNSIIVATASWTPFENGVSLISNKKKINFIGTANKEKADYIYTNYFYEIDIRHSRKYDIPKNFILFKTLYIDGIKVYSIYKKNF